MLERLATIRWGWLILFASGTTLVCCALPILLVTLGLGAVSAAMFANVPYLTELASHKIWFFGGSLVVLGAAAWALYRPGRTCPADPELARQCAAADTWNRRFLWTAVTLWTIGFAAAYLALPILNWLDG